MLFRSIIWRQHQAARFSFVEFWARRARRILPALFVMMAAVLANPRVQEFVTGGPNAHKRAAQ